MRTFPSLALACLLSLSAPAVLASASTDHHPSDRPDGRFAARSGHSDVAWSGAGAWQREDHGTAKPQTSDRRPGRIAMPLPSWRQSVGETAIRRRWQVAPGVRATVFDQQSVRGRVRAYLVSVKYRSKALRIDYADDGAVARTAPVARMIGRDHAIAGVNGDFFDIGRTGAPIGIGMDRDRGLLHGRLAGWNTSFTIDTKGRPEIGLPRVRTTIRQHPDLVVATLNTPRVNVDGIGVYNRRWGPSNGAAWTDHQKKHVRVVQVKRGRVVRNSIRVPNGTAIEGTLLVGRGRGAAALGALTVGSRATVRTTLDPAVRMAISGNEFLIDDGTIVATDDRIMHPRTAIGIDRDTHEVLLLAVDGRQSFSRGYTMVELADLMMDLGADEALNLDGGGSTTMLARPPRRSGEKQRQVGVINSPSDGYARPVANAVEVTYQPGRVKNRR